jgi:hypothetical protein
MTADRATQCCLTAVLGRLDEALALLDASDQGDSEIAALVERAALRAKRELRHPPALLLPDLPLPARRRMRR